jgi:ABC-type Fe3+/spermidine/putrescine transport system ATPase subunit
MIQIDQLDRTFGDFRLRIDHLRVESGRYAVVLGPSGAGKSLLLKAVAGLLGSCLDDAQACRVKLCDQDVSARPAYLRRVGMVFQDAGLFPHYSVRQNIAYGLSSQGLSRDQRCEKVEGLIHSLDLGAIVDRPVDKLSGGEAQKVALARALAIEPKVLLLDEPLSQVDYNARLGLQESLKKIHAQRPLTCLHVTHHREEARALGQDWAVMLGGRLLQMAPRGQVEKQPVCPFVAHFVGVDWTGGGVTCSEACLAGRGECDGLLLKHETREKS